MGCATGEILFRLTLQRSKAWQFVIPARKLLEIFLAILIQQGFFFCILIQQKHQTQLNSFQLRRPDRQEGKEEI